VPDDEYGVGVDVGDSTVAAAICPTGADGGRLPDRLALGGAPAGHVMAQVGSTALPRTTSAARAVADEVVRLAGLAADRQGRPPGRLAVAVPPFWGPGRSAALSAALDEAGAPPFSLVSAAVAAWQAAVLAGQLPPDATALVVDLGAATVDCAVVGRGPDGLPGHRGFPPAPLRWGGRDVDDAVLAHVRRFLDVPAERDEAFHARALALRAACTTAKEELSTQTAVDVPVDPAWGPGPIRLTREEFAELLADGIDGVVAAAEAALAAARTTSDRIDGLVLVGGGARTPVIAERLPVELGIPLVALDDPDLAPATGAAALAAAALLEDDATPAGTDDEGALADVLVLPARSRRHGSAVRRPEVAPGGHTVATPWTRAVLVAALLLAMVIAPLLLIPLVQGKTTGVPPGEQPAAAGEETAPASGEETAPAAGPAAQLVTARDVAVVRATGAAQARPTPASGSTPAGASRTAGTTGPAGTQPGTATAGTPGVPAAAPSTRGTPEPTTVLTDTGNTSTTPPDTGTPETSTPPADTSSPPADTGDTSSPPADTSSPPADAGGSTDGGTDGGSTPSATDGADATGGTEVAP